MPRMTAEATFGFLQLPYELQQSVFDKLEDLADKCAASAALESLSCFTAIIMSNCKRAV